MLEELLIFTRGGLVLWSLCQTLGCGGGGAAPRGSPIIDALIRSCLLEDRPASTGAGVGFSHGAYAVEWTFHNGLGLVFAAVHHRMLRIPYVADLLSGVRKEFARIYHPKRAAYDGFADTFRQLHLEAKARAEEMKNPKQEATASGSQQPHTPVVDSHGDATGNDDDNGKDDESDDGDSENGSSLANGSLKGEEDSQPSPGVVVNAFDVDKLRKLQNNKNNRKVIKPVPKQNFKPPRIWNGVPQSDKKLDYTDPADEKGDQVTEHVADKQGKSMMDKDDVEDGKPQMKGWFSTIFQSIAGNNVPNKSDLQPALKALKDRLMTKNVAEEITEKLCESVAASLEGKKLGSFTTLSSSVQTAMEEALLRILTSRRSIDILREVHAAKDRGRPYVIVFVGVNGVGKSTNLAKVAYWLLQHGLSVTLAACDTFRSGAVEQLRTHARRLQIPIFEKGYEKDPAVVAREAIQEACRKKSEVVLVDTAGRMQDNEPLMRALSKLINLNNPDLVLFVGEALVGNDSVDQLTKFNQKLADLSTAPTARLIDGILLTKFDTIDDKVGAALSMVYTSGAPVMFVGCGQSYTDLKKLNVKSIVKTLLL